MQERYGDGSQPVLEEVAIDMAPRWDEDIESERCVDGDVLKEIVMAGVDVNEQ